MQTVEVGSPADSVSRHMDRPEIRGAVLRGRLYDIATRFLGSSWFLLLAVLAARRTMGLAAVSGAAVAVRDGWPGLLAGACLAVFYSAI